MNKIYSKILLFCIAAVTFRAAAFDWPQKEVLSDPFFSYFGQLRGGTISTSLIFSDPSDIKAVEEGKILAVISEHPNEDGWFESTLGNAVIIAHKDNLLTVYGNLDTVKTINKSVETGTIIGHTGNSGWQQGKSCLEFQVLDTKNNTAINPRVLMPRIGHELPLYNSTLTIVDDKGNIYHTAHKKYLPAGEYYIYKKRQKTAVPYRTSISLNGVSLETISYDVLVQDSGKLCIQGKRKYSIEKVYPDDDSLLLGQVMLPHGQCILSITIGDILGKENTESYPLVID